MCARVCVYICECVFVRECLHHCIIMWLCLKHSWWPIVSLHVCLCLSLSVPICPYPTVPFSISPRYSLLGWVSGTELYLDTEAYEEVKAIYFYPTEYAESSGKSLLWGYYCNIIICKCVCGVVWRYLDPCVHNQICKCMKQSLNAYWDLQVYWDLCM